MPFDSTPIVEQNDEILTALRRARERVARPGGWCQDAMINGNKVCALGAVYVTCEDGVVRGGVFYYLVHVLLELSHYTSIGSYNDMLGRTQDDIVALFDRAITMRECAGR